MAEGGYSDALGGSYGGTHDKRFLKTIPLVSLSPKSKGSIVKAKDTRCLRQLREVKRVPSISLVQSVPTVQPVPAVKPVPMVQPVPTVQPIPLVQPVSTVQPVPLDKPVLPVPPPPVISLAPPVPPPPVISLARPVPPPRVISLARPDPPPPVISLVPPVPPPPVISLARPVPPPPVISLARPVPPPPVISLVPSVPPSPAISQVPPVSPPPLISAIPQVPTGEGEAHTDTDDEEMEHTRTLQSLRTRLANLDAEFLAAEADAEVEGLCLASNNSTADGGGGWRGAGYSQGHSPVHTKKEIEEAVETLESLRTHLLSLKTEITEDGGPCSSGTMPGGRGSQSPPPETHKASGNTSPWEHNSPLNTWSGDDGDHNRDGAPDVLPHRKQGTRQSSDIFWN